VFSQPSSSSTLSSRPSAQRRSETRAGGTWSTTISGRVVNTAGDGVFAIFDGPARAIKCARAVRDVVGSLGLAIRCGIHTGECVIEGDDVAGIAVHIGARVAAHADPGEILLSSTVKDLIAGSRVECSDRGSHVLKGVAGRWRLFAIKE
jgi:class 3 adenylate cyclase